eukprot:3849167-Prymnesium_polylepis.1
MGLRGRNLGGGSAAVDHHGLHDDASLCSLSARRAIRVGGEMCNLHVDTGWNVPPPAHGGGTGGPGPHHMRPAKWQVREEGVPQLRLSQ